MKADLLHLIENVFTLTPALTRTLALTLTLKVGLYRTRFAALVLSKTN